MTARAVLLAVLACAPAVGCGTQSADLLVIDRAGLGEGADIRLVVRDGGEVLCPGGKEARMTSAQLIEARDVVRQLEGEREEVGPADRGLVLPPGPGSVLRYQVRVEAGTVRFADTSAGQPQVFYRAAKLARDLSREACGLPR